MIKKTLECRQIHLFVDIHGHSRQNNLFMYGCAPDPPKTATGLPKQQFKVTSPSLSQRERLLPTIMERCMDWFSVMDCSFVIHKSKETTGRVVMFREFGVKNSYTMEASFCGPTKGLHKDTHFS